jgi:hypothetical protein
LIFNLFFSVISDYFLLISFAVSEVLPPLYGFNRALSFTTRCHNKIPFNWLHLLASELEHKLDAKLDPKLDYKLEHKLDPELDAKLDQKLDYKLDYQLDPELDDQLDL